MRTILGVLLCAASCHGADWFLMQTGPDTFKRLVDFNELPYGATTIIKVSIPDGETPTPPADDLAAQTRKRARAINEPRVAQALSVLWQQAAQGLTNGNSWAVTIAGIQAAHETTLTVLEQRGLTQKKSQWDAWQAVTMQELTPQTAETLLQVSAGLAAAGDKANLDIGALIEAITCMVDAFTAERPIIAMIPCAIKLIEAFADPAKIPKGQSRVSRSPTQEKRSVPRRNAAPVTFYSRTANTQAKPSTRQAWR